MSNRFSNHVYSPCVMFIAAVFIFFLSNWKWPWHKSVDYIFNKMYKVSCTDRHLHRYMCFYLTYLLWGFASTHNLYYCFCCEADPDPDLLGIKLGRVSPHQQHEYLQALVKCISVSSIDYKTTQSNHFSFVFSPDFAYQLMQECICIIDPDDRAVFHCLTPSNTLIFRTNIIMEVRQYSS